MPKFDERLQSEMRKFPMMTNDELSSVVARLEFERCEFLATWDDGYALDLLQETIAAGRREGERRGFYGTRG